MDYLDTKSMRSIDAPSITSIGSGGTIQTVPSNFFSGPKDNVKVVIRVRPLNEKEKNQGNAKKCVSVENSFTVLVDAKPDTKAFNFDFVGHENLDQETVFNQIAKPIADSCLEGYNGSIFAYGQTGAGKTFTIQGTGVMLSGYGYFEQKIQDTEDYQKRGIMSRSFEYIFDCISKAKKEAEDSNGDCQFQSLVRCSYLEIYNEQIMDLLDPESQNLHIREDIKKGVYVEGLNEEVVTSAQDVLDLILQGSKNRHVGSTSMNKESSRSHSVLTTIIETKSMKESGGLWNIKSSRFHIIDLAGSERQKYTNAMGERLKEAGMINKSLSALGNVINSLVDISEGKNRHVHYRDSKLTFLLRDSLGGNSKTVIIANISPSQQCAGETLSTLKFAQRAKLIRNKAVINEDSSGTIHLLKQEITRLKKELAETEQRMQSSSLQCAFCRNNINGDQNLDDDLNDDEMLLDQSLLNQSVNLSQTLLANLEDNTEGKIVGEQFMKQFKKQKIENQNFKKRVVYLENLLTANLDNLTSQQKYYESELAKGQQQVKRLQQANDSYEKQCARDKMIIKFREDRIQKLETHQPLTQDEKQKQIGDLKKEIQLWKDAVDKNPQTAKLFAEKADLQKQLEQYKKETKQTPDSLSAQMRSLTELNEGLNEYLRLYCEESKKEVEQELSRVKLDYGEKIEEMNLRLEELTKKDSEWQEKYEKVEKERIQAVSQFKAEIEVLKEKNQEEKQEIERLNKEAIVQIKKEIEEISEDKTEQEKEAQVLKVQLKEKERDLEKEIQKKEQIVVETQSKEVELKQEIENLTNKLSELQKEFQKEKQQAKSSLEEANALLEQEKKQYHQKIKQEGEKWEKQMQELERQFLAEQSEREMVQEQCDEMTQRIKSLQNENETFQQTLLCKEEEVQELERNVKAGEKDLDEMKEQNQKSQEIISSKEREVGNLRKELEKALKDCEDLREALKQIQDEIANLEVEKKNLLDQLDQYKKLQDLLKEEIQEKGEKIENLKNQIQDLQSKISELENSQSTQIQNLNTEKVEIQQKLQESSQKIQKLEDQVVQLNKESQKQINEYILEIEKVKKEKSENQSSLSEKIQIQETEKSNLQTKFENQIKSLQESHQQTTQALEQSLKDQITSLETDHQLQLDALREENLKIINDLQSQIKQLESQSIEFERNLQETSSSRVQTENSLKLQMMKQEQQFNEKMKQKDLEIRKVEKDSEEQINYAKQELQQKETQILLDSEILKKGFEQDRQMLHDKIHNKEKELEDHKKNSQQLICKLEQELQEFKSKVEEMEKLNSSLSQESSEHVKKLTEELGLKNQKVEKLNAQWREQMEVNQNQMEQLEQVTEEINSLQQMLQQVKSENSDITDALQEVKLEKNQNLEKIFKLEKEKESLEEELKSQKKQNETYVNSINDEHIKKYQEIHQTNQSARNALEIEIDKYKSHCKELNSKVAQYKSKLEQQNDILRSNKDTISGMVVKENDLMLELEKKINELKDHQDKWKQRVQDSKEEKEQLRKEWERLKKENENLRELVKLKDRQIEEQLNQDERERDQTEKIFKENKELRNQITKREFEMKEVVRTLKFYSEEKSRLEKELEKLHRENDQLIGHKNPSQKIQHHLKIKEENNKLREENFKLQEELRRKTDILIKKGISMSKDVSSPAKQPLQQTNENQTEQQQKEDAKKLRKDNLNFQETINRLVDHILSQPGLMKMIGINDDIYDKIQQSTGNTKVKNAMEIISLFNNVIQNKDRELKEVIREKKKVDCRLDIVEKEKNLCKQQLELIQNSGQSQSQSQAYMQKGYREPDSHQTSKRRLEGIGSQERMTQNEFVQFQQQQQQKQMPQQMYGYKQQMSQKEGNQSRKDLFNVHRNSSGVRGGAAQYLHSNTQYQK